MKIREDVLSTEDVLNILLENLKNKTAISITRYGDGEAIILNGYKDADSLKAIFKRQFGYTPTLDQVDDIRNNLIRAYQDCDIIGGPWNKKIKDSHSYWAKSGQILQDEAEIRYLTTKKLLTSIDVHSHFLDRGYYDLLLNNTTTLNYISCRDLDDRFKERYPNLKTVNKFIIAPEVKFSTNMTGERHYPEQFIKIGKWMDRAINCEGALCLVGAGVVGKIYCNWFRDRGGVAMDIGSVFDSWAGKDTRGPSRGLDKEDNAHKL